MTYLQIVNKVMRRLREEPVSSVSETDYAELIGILVNETKREVEDAWRWMKLRTTIAVTTTADTYRYVLTGAGERFQLLYAFNDTDDTELKIAPSKWMTKQFKVGNTQNGSPLYFDFNGVEDGDPVIDLWPIPDGAYSLEFSLVIPQEDLSADSDVLTIPSYPVILGAYAKAVAERGEDGSTSHMRAEASAHNAFADALALEARHFPHEFQFNVE